MPVYAIRCGDYVKVGTTSLPTARRRLKQIQAMCPYPCTLIGTSREDLDTAPLTLEAHHHHRLRHFHHWGEWYRWGPGVEMYLKAYFLPLNEVAPKGGPPPRRVGPHKTRLRDVAKGRLDGKLAEADGE